MSSFFFFMYTKIRYIVIIGVEQVHTQAIKNFLYDFSETSYNNKNDMRG